MMLYNDGSHSIILMQATGMEQEAHICVELPHKGGEVVVLEVLRQELFCTLGLVPHCEAAPQDDSLAEALQPLQARTGV